MSQENFWTAYVLLIDDMNSPAFGGFPLDKHAPWTDMEWTDKRIPLTKKQYQTSFQKTKKAKQSKENPKKKTPNSCCTK